MTEKQALALLDAIVEETPQCKVEVYRIGNGEHVVTINSILIWSPEDWQANRVKILGVPTPLAL